MEGRSLHSFPPYSYFSVSAGLIEAVFHVCDAIVAMPRVNIVARPNMISRNVIGTR